MPEVLVRPGLNAGVRAAGLAGLGALLAMRILEFRRDQLLPAWTEFPQALALGLAALAAGPLTAGMGLFFTCCYFRAVYASTRRTVTATIGAVALFGVCASASGAEWRPTFVSGAFGLAASTLLTRMLVATLMRQHVQVAHQATHDRLTGLANRALLTQTIEEALVVLRDGGPGGAVLLLDLDGFKRINDSLGHAFGDEVLQAVAGRLRSSLRPSDLLARLGGDEFAVLLGHGGGATEVAHRICQVLRAPVSLPRSRVSVSASIGLVRLDADQNAAGALAAADLAMYAAKAAGPGRVQEFHPGLRDALDQRLQLESDLRRALDQEDFELHYQPFVNLETGRVTGTEALVRWRHPTRGHIPPVSFIPIVEDNGMIIPLGRWILRTACSTAAAWQPSDPAQVCTMAVNVSACQLEDPAFVDDVVGALSDSGLPAQALTLEITESALVDESPALLERLQALKALGVRIAIDDFGTGYSSLSRLSTFPVDTLKIDRSFVENVENETGNALVRAILELAHALELDVVAEGIESRGQARALASLGCRVAQGFYFARPAPATGTSPPESQISAVTVNM